MKVSSKKRFQRKTERQNRIVLGVIASILIFVLAGWFFFQSIRGGIKTAVEFPHIHGLGFSPEGNQLIVAAHDGIRVFENGKWTVPDVPPNDYMGYTATDNGFYSSGHPHPGSGLVNPLGLVKGSAGGRNLEQLAFEGESDFHLMGVGYFNHAIYVLNPTPNSKLVPGLHYSLDDGKTWNESPMQGITAEPIQIAVHPTKADTVVIASEMGLFFSSDYGNTFEKVGDLAPVTAAAFSPQGDKLFIGYQTLYTYILSSGQVEILETPEISSQDAIAFIGINPKNSDDFAFATFERQIYLSKNGGKSWSQIAKTGKGIEG